jgi:hypothetical protein
LYCFAHAQKNIHKLQHQTQDEHTKLFVFELPKNIGSHAVFPFQEGISEKTRSNPNGSERKMTLASDSSDVK